MCSSDLDTTTGASTTGTASTVSPSTIAVGGSLTYTLSGFPPSSTVEVLVDDGGLVQQDSSDAGVVARISVSEDGTFSGAVELPVYITEGTRLSLQVFRCVVPLEITFVVDCPQIPVCRLIQSQPLDRCPH